MKTTWTGWAPDDIRDAAEAAAREDFAALGAPARHHLAPLPYYGAYAEYEEHVTRCAECLRAVESDCPEGEVLFSAARVGLGEQRRVARNN